MSARFRRDREGALHKVIEKDGVEGFIARFTTECSGCYEVGDYGGGAQHYPYDKKARCRVGAGCDECGYTGKRRVEEWVPFDWTEYQMAHAPPTSEELG